MILNDLPLVKMSEDKMKPRLTQRDLECCKELLDLGCLTAKQLVALSLFPNEKKARDRLRLLNHDGYIAYCSKPYLGPGRAEYVYYINQKKAGEILGLLGRLHAAIAKPTAYSPILLHHLAITDFVICLRRACKQSGLYNAVIIPEYKRIAGKGKLKKATNQTVILGGMPNGIIPDGVACLSRNNVKTLFFFEIYRGLQSLEGGERSIQRKLETYAAYLDQGLYSSFSELFSYRFRGFRVLLVASSESYLEGLKRICSQISPSNIFWIALDKEIASSVFGRIWHVPGENCLKAIVNKGDIRDEKAN
jgi:hypothetical protein